MRLSTITFTATMIFVLIFLLGTNFLLKSELGKKDKKDIFNGFRKNKTKSFSYVKLQGLSDANNRIEILQGDNFGVNTIRSSDFVVWYVQRDTLIVVSRQLFSQDLHVRAFLPNPSLYITTPTLKGVIGHDAHFRIRDFKSQRLEVTVTGGNLLMSGCQIGDLSAMAELLGTLSIDEKNTIDKANIVVGERGFLNVEKNVFKSFQVSADSTGSVQLPEDLVKSTK